MFSEVLFFCVWFRPIIRCFLVCARFKGLNKLLLEISIGF